MSLEKWLFTLFAGLFTLLVGLMISIKKPICIDSRTVDKIDRILSDKTETMYRCSNVFKSNYSRFFDENKDLLESRTESIILFLKNIESFKENIVIEINENDPSVFNVEQHKIIIGKNLLESDGHLERAIIKVWLSERLKSNVSSQLLFIEVAADFLYYAAYGDLEIEDPVLKLKTKIGGSRWPQVLKSKEGYCDSPWKISEHFSYCGNHKLNNELSEDLLLSLSLRPLMTSVWIKAYSELSFQEKHHFISLISRYLQTQQLSSEKAIEMVMSDIHPLKQGMMNIKKITDLMNSSSLIQNEIEYREFYSRVAQNLQLAGVSDSFAEAYFDYLFEYPNELSSKSLLFQNLEKIAEANPQLQIAIKDKKQIWILPGLTGLPLTSFDQIKSQQHIYLACLGLKEIDMSQFFNQTEKLLLIKGCDQTKDINFKSLVLNGVRYFSKTNKQLAFIQFHLPSFEMKAKELSHIKNFFELVRTRDVSKPEFQTLGWSQIQWYEDSQAYKPQAVVDAIELFRTEATN